ncbi:MAG: type II toxin-antitoxin system death-on-curing family toxin, partial [Chloroflexi bacterium]|nr:type II toxin-antitoxin system death-on-curing family toxin [Chloroflexota bacterium]
MTRYITVDDVIAYHEAILRDGGARPAPLLSFAKLESALLGPSAEAFGKEFYPELAEKAAALLQGVVIAHPFLDGNKRAGLAAMLLFLALNGVATVPELDALYDFVIAVTTGELREVEDIASRLRSLFAPH